MRARDYKYIDAGRRHIDDHNRFGMNYLELERFLKKANQSDASDRVDAILEAFYLGVEAGYRIAQKEVENVKNK